MKKLITLLLGSTLLFSAVACDTARTSVDAPDSVDDSPVVEDAMEVEETLEDADSNTRQAQLNSDICAREQRNDWLGDQQERADSDIESEVRAKLEANIPRSKLTVDAEDGNVVIVGTVSDQREYETIRPLAEEITGVKSLKMEVEILPPANR